MSYLWIFAKSWSTLDGCKPIDNGISHPSTGARFRNHPQYHDKFGWKTKNAWNPQPEYCWLYSYMVYSMVVNLKSSELGLLYWFRSSGSRNRQIHAIGGRTAWRTRGESAKKTKGVYLPKGNGIQRCITNNTCFEPPIWKQCCSVVIIIPVKSLTFETTSIS